MILTLELAVSIECACVTRSSKANSVRSLPPNVTAETTEAGLPVTMQRVSRAESIPSTEHQCQFLSICVFFTEVIITVNNRGGSVLQRPLWPPRSEVRVKSKAGAPEAPNSAHLLHL